MSLISEFRIFQTTDVFIVFATAAATATTANVGDDVIHYSWTGQFVIVRGYNDILLPSACCDHFDEYKRGSSCDGDPNETRHFPELACCDPCLSVAHRSAIGEHNHHRLCVLAPLIQ